MEEHLAVDPEPPPGDALSALRHSIERLHIHNGAPSTRTISNRTGKAVSHTTVHGVLRCTKLPTWGQLELVVEQLNGNIEDFRPLWIAARNEQQGSTEPKEPPLVGIRPGSSKPDAEDSIDSRPQPPEQTTESISDLFVEFLDNLEKVSTPSFTRVPTGFTDLDILLGAGISPGQFVVITGRPAIGKSTFALDICRSATTRRGLPALLMSFRLTKTEVLRRFVSAETRIALHVLRAAMLSDGDWDKLARGLQEIGEAPLFINDGYAPSIATVTREVRRVVADYDVKLVVIDSIQQLMSHQEDDLRRRELREMSRAFKLLALELHVPIVAVSGVGHGVDDRASGPPELDELGGIDEEADVVIAVHRPDYYDLMSPRAGEVDLIVCKHREGPTDTITVAGQLHLSRFVDLAWPSPHLGPDESDQETHSDSEPEPEAGMPF